jgi:hypothetical protein
MCIPASRDPSYPRNSERRIRLYEQAGDRLRQRLNLTSGTRAEIGEERAPPPAREPRIIAHRRVHYSCFPAPIELRDKPGDGGLICSPRGASTRSGTPPAQQPTAVAVALLKDLAIIPLQRPKGDREAGRDVPTASAHLWRLRRDLLAFRRAHRNWERIDFDTEVYCADSPKG